MAEINPTRNQPGQKPQKPQQNPSQGSKPQQPTGQPERKAGSSKPEISPESDVSRRTDTSSELNQSKENLRGGSQTENTEEDLRH